MADLNPINNEFVLVINDLKNRIGAIEKTRQQYIGDWYEFNISDITYVSDNVIQFATDYLVSVFFSVGDKIKITQTTTKYFYIVGFDVPNNRIYLEAGDVYLFDNTAFTSFAKSNVVSPVGFPGFFIQTPLVNDGTVTDITLGTEKTQYFTITGSLVYVQGLLWGTSAGGCNYFPVKMPVALGSGFTVKEFTTRHNPFAGPLGRGFGNSAVAYNNFIRSYADAGPMSAGTLYTLAYQYQYIIQ